MHVDTADYEKQSGAEEEAVCCRKRKSTMEWPSGSVEQGKIQAYLSRARSNRAAPAMAITTTGNDLHDRSQGHNRQTEKVQPTQCSLRVSCQHRTMNTRVA